MSILFLLLTTTSIRYFDKNLLGQLHSWIRFPDVYVKSPVFKMSSPGVKRIGKEYEEITKNPPFGMKISLADESDLHKWVIVMDGPKYSPYAGGKFTVNLTLPAEYPFKPPKISFKTRIFHPNISNDDTGSMCLGLLKAEAWKPPTKIAAVLEAAKQLLSEPLPDDNVEQSIAELYKNDKKTYEAKAREYVKQYAKEQ